MSFDLDFRVSLNLLIDYKSDSFVSRVACDTLHKGFSLSFSLLFEILMISICCRNVLMYTLDRRRRPSPICCAKTAKNLFLDHQQFSYSSPLHIICNRFRWIHYLNFLQPRLNFINNWICSWINWAVLLFLFFGVKNVGAIVKQMQKGKRKKIRSAKTKNDCPWT